MICALQVFNGSRVAILLQEMILVGNVERREDRNAHSFYRMCLLGHCSHLRVNVFGELDDVVRIRPTKIVGLIKDFYPHAVARVIWLFCTRWHGLSSCL